MVDHSHTDSWLHNGFHMMLDQWQVTLLVTGAVIGYVMYWLHTVFATKKNVSICKDELAVDVDKKLDDLKESNSNEHHQIKTDVRVILDYILENKK